MFENVLEIIKKYIIMLYLRVKVVWEVLSLTWGRAPISAY